MPDRAEDCQHLCNRYCRSLADGGVPICVRWNRLRRGFAGKGGMRMPKPQTIELVATSALTGILLAAVIITLGNRGNRKS